MGACWWRVEGGRKVRKDIYLHASAERGRWRRHFGQLSPAEPLECRHAFSPERHGHAEAALINHCTLVLTSEHRPASICMFDQQLKVQDKELNMA